MEIDQIDRQILRIIQDNCNASMDQIASQVGLSRNACWRRIKSYEETGLIKARVTLLDPQALNVGLTVIALIRSSDHSQAWFEKFRTAIDAMPEVQSAYRMSGELDYVLNLRVADVQGYDAFYQRLIKSVPIKDISASFVMDAIKETTALPV